MVNLRLTPYIFSSSGSALSEGGKGMNLTMFLQY